MRNSLCFTAVLSGKPRYVEFAWIETISSVNITDTMRYYHIYVTNVVYADTGKTDEGAMFGLYKPDDCVTYLGKTYEFKDLDRLCMVVENEHNLAALESL